MTDEMSRVPRMYFGRMIAANLKLSHCCCKGRSDILGFGKRQGHAVKEEGPAGAQERDAILKQLKPTVAALDSHSLELEEGPYQDKDGLVADLVSDICRDLEGNDTVEIIERVIDRVRPFIDPYEEMSLPRKYGRSKYDFHINVNLTTSADTLVDALPVAGNILADEDRVSLNPITGSKKFDFTHPMEPFIMMVSVLRHRGIKAYPANAVDEGEEGSEMHSPIIAIVDPSKEIPLHTCAIQGLHPDMGSIDFMSDVAAMGLIYGLRAFMRTKHLTVESVKRFLQGWSLTEDETQNQVRRIGDAIVQCHKYWGEYNDFVRDALWFLHHEIIQAEAWINLKTALSGLQTNQKLPDPFLANRGIIEPAPMIPIDPEHLGMFFAMAEGFPYMYPSFAEIIVHAWAAAAEHAERIVNVVQEYINLEIESAPAPKGSDPPA